MTPAREACDVHGLSEPCRSCKADELVAPKPPPPPPEGIDWRSRAAGEREHEPTYLHPGHTFTRQAEEAARQRLRTVVGPEKEEAAFRAVVDLWATTTELTLAEAVDTVLAAGERDE